MKECIWCAEQINDGAIVCVKCGRRQSAYKHYALENPAFASVLIFIVSVVLGYLGYRQTLDEVAKAKEAVEQSEVATKKAEAVTHDLELLKKDINRAGIEVDKKYRLLEKQAHDLSSNFESRAQVVDMSLEESSKQTQLISKNLHSAKTLNDRLRSDLLKSKADLQNLEETARILRSSIGDVFELSNHAILETNRVACLVFEAKLEPYKNSFHFQISELDSIKSNSAHAQNLMTQIYQNFNAVILVIKELDLFEITHDLRCAGITHFQVEEEQLHEVQNYLIKIIDLIDTSKMNTISTKEEAQEVLNTDINWVINRNKRIGRRKKAWEQKDSYREDTGVFIIYSATPGGYDLNFIPRSSQTILFDNNSYSLSTVEKKLLDGLSNELEIFSNPQLIVTGHSNPDEADTEDLSRKRALAVRDYIVAKGINAERIIVEFAGSNYPIADHNTEEGKRVNRRVDLDLKSPLL